MDKLTEQFTVKLSLSQLNALEAEAALRGVGMADVVRSFLTEIHERHQLAFRLLEAEMESKGNEVNNGNK